MKKEKIPSIRDPNGKYIHINNKPTLVVNYASKCGLANTQYKDLEKLKEKWPNLVIIMAPCNQFRGEEEGQCSINNLYIDSKKYIITELVKVNGCETHPLFNFLKAGKSWGIGIKRIRWNFEKFMIINKKVVARYSPFTSPLKVLEWKNRYPRFD